MKVNSPLISIIVPVYNAEKYLRRCLESIIGQTYPNFEVLLIDDGSSDRSGEMCDEYAAKDNRLRVFHQKNAGIGTSRNLGILNSRGGYLTFIDSDDYISPTHIQSFVEQLKEGIDWVILGIRAFDENGKTIWTSHEQAFKVSNKQNMDEYADKIPTFVWVTNKLYKASYIRDYNLKFITTSNIGEDRLFNIEYYQYACSMKFIPNSTYNYFVNTNSITRKNPKELPAHYFLNTANRADEVLGQGMLGKNMGIYVANFCVQFYCRTLGLCFFGSSKMMSLRERLNMFRKLVSSILHSVILRKYNFRLIRLFYNNVVRYAKKM